MNQYTLMGWGWTSFRVDPDHKASKYQAMNLISRGFRTFLNPWIPRT